MKRKEGIYVVNVSPENWPSCRDALIFGLPESDGLWLRLNEGDLVLVRLAHLKDKNYGCIAIWAFVRDEKVPNDKKQGPNEVIPWSDTRYEVKQYFRELAKFTRPLCENFDGRRKISTKLEGWQAQIFRGSLLQLTVLQTKQYITLLLNEKGSELSSDLRRRLEQLAA
jgi:hypothetical protein